MGLARLKVIVGQNRFHQGSFGDPDLSKTNLRRASRNRIEKVCKYKVLSLNKFYRQREGDDRHNVMEGASS